MLTAEMQYIIRNFNAGSVATVDADGRPKVSPKATFLILDDATIAFANIRSPGTIANLRCNPTLEVCSTDILARKAVSSEGGVKVGSEVHERSATAKTADIALESGGSATAMTPDLALESGGSARAKTAEPELEFEGGFPPGLEASSVPFVSA